MVSVNVDCSNDNINDGYITEILDTARILTKQKEIEQLIGWFHPKIAYTLKSYEEILEFCEAGGVEQLCDIIELLTQNHEYFYALIPLLEEIALLSSISHPSYDDHIGDIPILVYFLTERDRFYIDINWKYHEMKLMDNFCRLHLELLCDPFKFFPQNFTDGFNLALSNLSIAVCTYPQHRVTPAMSELFNRYISSNLIESLMESCAFENPILSIEVSNLVCSILTLGLGLGFCENLPPQILLMASQNALNLGLRCACNYCELNRKLRKVAINRDEFGIPATYKANKRIPHSFKAAKGLKLLKIIIQELISIPYIKIEYEQKDENNLRQKYNSGIRSASWSFLISFICEEEGNFNSKDELKRILDIVAFVVKQTTDISSLYPENLLNKLKDKTSGMNSLFIVIEYVCIRLFCYNPESLMNIFFDLKKLAINLTNLLQRLDSEISADSFALVIIISVPFIQLYFLLKSHMEKEQTNQFSRICESVDSLEISNFHSLVPNLELNNRNDYSQKYLNEPSKLRHNTRNSGEININPIYDNPDINFIENCQSLYNIYEIKQGELNKNDKHIIISNLLIYMASITEVRNASFMPELRKRFYKPPRVQCGWMVHVLRKLGISDPKCFNGNLECNLNRRLAELVISQAESASALYII